MALILKDRVKETTTTAGTGTVTLAGAATGYQTFAAIGNANTTYYCIAGQGTSEWEVGIGTYTSSGTTLSRDTVLASSNSGSLVTFSAGTKDVFATYPSEKSVNQDATGLVTVSSGLTSTGVTSVLDGTNFLIKNTADNTKIARFDLSGLTTANSYSYVLPNTTGSALASLGNLAQTFTGQTTFSSNLNATSILNLTGVTSGTHVFGTSTTTGTISIGGTAQTGAIALGQATTAATVNISNGITSTGNTNTINIGASGAAGSFMAANIGSNTGASTITIRGTLTVANVASNILLGSGQTTGTIIIGATGGTGTITLGRPTGSSQQIDIANAVLATGNTQTINMGASAAAGSTTAITIGSTAGTSTTTLNGTVTLANALPIGSGGTGQTTQTSAFDALAPTTTIGDMIYYSGTDNVRLAMGTTGQVLQANTGAAPSWGTVSSMVYPGAGIAVSTGSAWTTSLTAPSGTIVGTTDTQTLTNKRVTPRIGTTTGAASPITPTADTADQYNVTALAVAATIAIPSGTPTDGQKLTLRIKDNGTARALTWTTSAGGYRIVGTTLPTTTFISKTVYVGCVYNAADSFWDVVAVSQQA